MSPPVYKGPLFVVGMWRSGTSLLYALLNQHPGIKLMYEGDLPLLRPLFWGGSNGDWLERWEFWNQALSRHHLTSARLPHSVSGPQAGFPLVYQLYAGDAIWGCKSPNYYDRLEKLAKAYPDARFIVIWRDIGDICRSIIQAAKTSRWFARPCTMHRALLGYRELKRQCDLLRRLGASVCEIQYDDLLRDPARTLTEVCRFLDIPFDQRMTSLEDADRSAIYSAPHHAGVKSKSIRLRASDADSLPPPLRKKIERYIRLWRSEGGADWPLCPHSENEAAFLPSLFERVCDRIIYGAVRGFDSLTILVYSLAPLGMLRLYRKAKSGPRIPTKLENALETKADS